jgi:hypothetical protein
MVTMLAEVRIELLVFSLDAIHFHLLGRFPNARVRPLVGRAKTHAYFELREQGFIGRLWSAGAHVVPISGRQHQLNVFRYVCDHRLKGAWLWTFRDGRDGDSPGQP